MINSDETSVANASSSPFSFCFREPHEKYNKDLVNKNDHVKPTISVMFWAAIWKTGRSRIITMTRDPLAKKNGYSSWSYQKALREGILPIYDGSRQFQQDNASIHNSDSTVEWLLDHAISWIDWPPNSPDLCPIENVWAILKRQLKKQSPHLRDFKRNKVSIAEFTRCVELAWAAIPQDKILRCINSLEKRLQGMYSGPGLLYQILNVTIRAFY
jgi:hypothetical protein